MRAAAAFDHLQRMVHFIGTIHIHRQARHFVELHFGNAHLRQQFRSGFRGRHRAFDVLAAHGQGFDKFIHGAAGADADVFIIGHEFHGFFGRQTL